MTKETITRVKLTATDGMIITDGTTYGTVIYLAEGVAAETFCEITKEEYERILEEQRRINGNDF